MMLQIAFYVILASVCLCSSQFEPSGYISKREVTSIETTTPSTASTAIASSPSITLSEIAPRCPGFGGLPWISYSTNNTARIFIVWCEIDLPALPNVNAEMKDISNPSPAKSLHECITRCADYPGDIDGFGQGCTGVTLDGDRTCFLKNNPNGYLIDTDLKGKSNDLASSALMIPPSNYTRTKPALSLSG